MSKFFRAVDNGDISKVKKLLRSSEYDVNECRLETGSTALMVACHSGNLAIVAEMLKDHRCLVDAKNNRSYTALHFAAEQGHVEIAKTLINVGAKVNLQNIYQRCPLHIASELGHTDVVVVLLEAGASMSVKCYGGYIPLALAAASGHVKTVTALLSKGSCCQTADNEGNTSLHLACKSGHEQVAWMLIYKETSPKVKNVYSDTPLHLASANGHLGTVKMLIEKGNAISTVEWLGFGGHTPEGLAQLNGHRKVVKYLKNLERGKIIGLENTLPVSVSTNGLREEYKKKVGHFLVMENKAGRLGTGSFGVVYRGIYETGGEEMAIKVIEVGSFAENPLRELNTYRSLAQHQNIVAYIDHMFDPGYILAIAMELCNLGNLEDFFKAYSPTRKDRVELMNQACAGLCHLHRQNPAVVHRDLKPRNMLMTRSGGQNVLKLADFGLAKITNSSSLSTVGGTHPYMAPEVFPSRERVAYTKEVDIFSLGVVFLAMIQFIRGQGILEPVYEGVPQTGISIGWYMKITRERGEAVPDAIVVKDEDGFELVRLKQLINGMTRCNVEERRSLHQVRSELDALLSDLDLTMGLARCDIKNKRSEVCVIL